MGKTDQRLYFRVLLLISLAFALGCLYQYHYGYYAWVRDGFERGNDDAFISFRYSVNLIDHGVLTFNPSDSPLVEGYSNPLLVLLMAGVYAIGGLEAMYPTSALLGFVSAIGALIYLVRSLREREGLTGAAFVGMAAALSPSIWIHTTSGMETGLVIALQVVMWAEIIRSQTRAEEPRLTILMLSSILLVLLRTDGFSFPLIVTAYCALLRQFRIGFALLFGIIGTFLLLTAARYGYYGELLPNVTHVKTGISLSDRFPIGIRLLGSVGYRNGLLPAVIACAVMIVKGAKGPYRAQWVRSSAFEPLTFFLLLSYYLYVGGDFYRDRFLLILFPMGALLLWRLVAHARPMLKWASCVVLIAAGFAAFGFDHRLSEVADKSYDRFEFVGRFLGRHYPGKVLATGAAGKIPFYSGMETIDMLGLNNRYIARLEPKGNFPGHSHWDADWVLSQRPDVICCHAYGDGGLTYDLDRQRYERSGYKLRYLVLNRGHEREPIVDASEMSRTQIAALIESGYYYAILERIDS